MVFDLTTMTSTSISGFHNSSIPVELSYNTEYRVSLMASHCGKSSVNVLDFHFGKLVDFVQLHNYYDIHNVQCKLAVVAVKCGYPLNMWDESNNSIPAAIVTRYSDPAIVGSNVTITCPSGAGNETAVVLTCLSNGRWCPDPQLIGRICGDSLHQYTNSTTPEGEYINLSP